MKKKIYQRPAIITVQLAHQTALLAASNDNVDEVNATRSGYSNNGEEDW